MIFKKGLWKLYIYTHTHNYWHVLLWLIHNNNNNSFRVTDLREKDVAPIIIDHIISYEF